MSSIKLYGPLKIYPRADGERLKFKFRNKTGEDIHDLWIVTGSPGFTPEVKKIIVKTGGNEVEIESGLEPGDESDNVHILFIDEIKKNALFTITLDFDEDFDDDEWIRFTPTDEDGASIITAKSVACNEPLAMATQLETMPAGHRVKRIKRNSIEEQKIVARHLKHMSPSMLAVAKAEADAKG